MKNHGYELEHNFGHGKQYPAMTFAALNLLAFAWNGLPETMTTGSIPPQTLNPPKPLEATMNRSFRIAATATDRLILDQIYVN